MTRPAEWIVATYKSRRSAEAPLRGRASQIAATYDGIVSVPLPELDSTENAAVANLLTQGLDQMAMRIASVSPQVICPPLIPGQRKSEDNARIRRLAIGGWWQQNRFDRKERKRARWLIGYAGSPVIIRPDRKRQIPVWELRNPLSFYPAAMPEADDICPTDSIFAITRSWSWIKERHPLEARMLNPATSPDPDDKYEVLEYIDADEHVMVAVGKPPMPTATPWGARKSAPQGAPFVELMRFPNLVGRCTVVAPHRLSLNQPQGQFDQMPAIYQMQARMMALSIIATERAIFPDLWFISRPMETVTVVERPDGRQGIPGLVKGGDLKEVNVAPPPNAMQMVDYLERVQRVTASISSDFGGEAPSNVRTARAGDQLLKATVDYWVQEAQETLGLAHSEENRLAIAVTREYFGSTKKSFYVNFKGTKGPVDYIPNVHFDTDANDVAWPFAGSDANQLAVRIGQKLGLQVMSKRTAQELDPDIDDPDLEHDRITSESMEAALLASIDQAVAAGQIGPLEVARLYELVAEHKMSLFEAFQKVHQETQDLQAQSQGGPPGPGLPGGPSAGPGEAPPSSPGPPGLIAPGIQAQLGLGPGNPPGGGPAAPTPGVAHMSQLLSMIKNRKAS